MKKLIVALFLLSEFVNAQTSPVTLRSESKPDRSIVIYADNPSSGNYTVRLSFSNLTGYTTTLDESAVAIVGPGGSQIATIKPQENAVTSPFTYSYRTYLGKALGKVPDTNFPYLLPTLPQKKVTVQKAKSLGELIGQKEGSTFFAFDFSFKLGDTVCATRAGTVIELMDTVRVGERKSQAYSQQRNTLIIEHKDGSLARLSFTGPVRSLVQVGERVIPGQPVAIFDRENEKYRLILSVSFLDRKSLLSSKNIEDEKKAGYYITLPIIWTYNNNQKSNLGSDFAPQEVTVIHPVENISTELTKKEKKRLGLD